MMLSLPGLRGAVHYQEIPAADPFALHGVSVHPHCKSSRLIAHQVAVEVQDLLPVIRGGRGKSGFDKVSVTGNAGMAAL